MLDQLYSPFVGNRLANLIFIIPGIDLILKMIVSPVAFHQQHPPRRKHVPVSQLEDQRPHYDEQDLSHRHRQQIDGNHQTPVNHRNLQIRHHIGKDHG